MKFLKYYESYDNEPDWDEVIESFSAIVSDELKLDKLGKREYVDYTKKFNIDCKSYSKTDGSTVAYIFWQELFNRFRSCYTLELCKPSKYDQCAILICGCGSISKYRKVVDNFTDRMRNLGYFMEFYVVYYGNEKDTSTLYWENKEREYLGFEIQLNIIEPQMYIDYLDRASSHKDYQNPKSTN